MDIFTKIAVFCGKKIVSKTNLGSTIHCTYTSYYKYCGSMKSVSSFSSIEITHMWPVSVHWFMFLTMNIIVHYFCLFKNTVLSTIQLEQEYNNTTAWNVTTSVLNVLSATTQQTLSFVITIFLFCFCLVINTIIIVSSLFNIKSIIIMIPSISHIYRNLSVQCI